MCDIRILILDFFFSRWKVCSQEQFIANTENILILMYLRLQNFEWLNHPKDEAGCMKITVEVSFTLQID
jgi:hypothetical protein